MTGHAALPKPKPLQFTLRQLFLAFVLCAVVLALYGYLGITGLVIAFFVASLGAVLYGTYRANYWFWLGLPGVATVAMGGLLPTLCMPRTVARQLQCTSHLHEIAAALTAYHDAKGTYPPAYIADAGGQPLHSWRVLILPYLGRDDLYARYRFDEPWDGPHNRALLAEMPAQFGCPSEPGPMHGRTQTSYLAVVGPGTVWSGKQPVGMSKITDGTSNTLLVVEVHDSGIAWLEPRDLHVAQMTPGVNPLRGQGISSRHGSRNDNGRGTRAQAVFCDGHTQLLPNDLRPETLHGLLTIAGGEQIEDY